MTRTEFRQLILCTELNKAYNIEIEESKYHVLRYEIANARKTGFEIRCKTKKQPSGKRLCVFVKTKQGNEVEYKIKYTV